MYNFGINSELLKYFTIHINISMYVCLMTINVQLQNHTDIKTNDIKEYVNN